MTDWTGEITGYRRDDGAVRLEVRPGPVKMTQTVLDQAEPEWLSRCEDLVTFHSVESDGSRRSYRYRIVGTDASGPEGGWVLTEPVLEVTP